VTEHAWLDRVAETVEDPEALLVARESTELAFMVALQGLPPRQRAVLLLRDVLEWTAKETAEALGTTTTAVNSALQRAHAALAGPEPLEDRRDAGLRPREAALLAALVQAWERADVERLAQLLCDDARLVMPPNPSWFDGRADVLRFLDRYAFRTSGERRSRALPIRANRQPALAVYKDRAPFGLMVLDVAGDGLQRLTLFRRPELFALWELPVAA
jgi:RNA polymerase sigma-70 factor (ECF subfamily)